MISLGSDIGMTMEDLWDLVNKNSAQDNGPKYLQDFNEFGVKKQVSFFTTANWHCHSSIITANPLLKGAGGCILHNYEAMTIYETT